MVFIIIATGNDPQYQRLCDILDLAELAEAPEYLTNADRIANRDALTKILTEKTRGFCKSDLLSACEVKGVPAGPINNMDEVFDDPQVKARSMQVTLDGVPGVRSPFRFSDAELSLNRPSPKLGEDN